MGTRRSGALPRDRCAKNGLPRALAKLVRAKTVGVLRTADDEAEDAERRERESDLANPPAILEILRSRALELPCSPQE
jgi:hypothetical protein